MRAIVTIDRQTASEVIVVWVTSRAERLRAAHTNAVKINVESDAMAMEKVRSLTARCAVLATEGSSLDGLPLEGCRITLRDIEGLIAETEERQQAILAGVKGYKRRIRSKSIKEPEFPPSPQAPYLASSDSTAIQRALTTANFVAEVWSGWLRTEEERRRRTVSPRTRLSPWMMPIELNSPEIAELPPLFAARLRAARESLMLEGLQVQLADATTDSVQQIPGARARSLQRPGEELVSQHDRLA